MVRVECNSMEEDLLQAICAAPEDVAVRLVYADWLDDRGQLGDADRAEFIRVQCRLASRQPLPVEERRRLLDREELLLAEWRKIWMQPFKGLFLQADFHCGFIERATLKSQTFLHQGESLLQRTPLRLIQLRDPSESIDELANCSTLRRLWGLNLDYGKLGAARIAQLLNSPYLDRLRWLDLGNNLLYRFGLEAVLRAAPRLPALRYLGLHDNLLGDAGVARLANSSLLKQLEALNLDGNRLSNAGLRALAESPQACNLAQLHIGRNYQLGLDGVETLLASPNLPALSWLHLDGFTSVDEAVQRLKARYGSRVEVNTDGRLVGLEYGPVAKL